MATHSHSFENILKTTVVGIHWSMSNVYNDKNDFQGMQLWLTVCLPSLPCRIWSWHMSGTLWVFRCLSYEDRKTRRFYHHKGRRDSLLNVLVTSFSFWQIRFLPFFFSSLQAYSRAALYKQLTKKLHILRKQDGTVWREPCRNNPWLRFTLVLCSIFYRFVKRPRRKAGVTRPQLVEQTLNLGNVMDVIWKQEKKRRLQFNCQGSSLTIVQKKKKEKS